MALEWGRYGINVNAICPGYIDTEINHHHWQTEQGQKLIDMLPRKRVGKPEDLDARAADAVRQREPLHQRRGDRRPTTASGSPERKTAQPALAVLGRARRISVRSKKLFYALRPFLRLKARAMLMFVSTPGPRAGFNLVSIR